MLIIIFRAQVKKSKKKNSYKKIILYFLELNYTNFKKKILCLLVEG
jgi:hypothetical protein